MQRENSRSTEANRVAWFAIAAIALAKLALNMAFSGRYGYFRDELYYIACSDHLAWGYVDQPPFCALLLAATRAVLGDALWAIRLPAALAGSGVVILAGLMARKLGGGRFAQILAALAAALSPVVLGNAGRYYSMNALDLLFWAAAFYLVLLIIVDERPSLWPWFGLVAGLGLMNKYSMGFLIIGIVCGMAMTSQRRHLFSGKFWLGALIAAAIFLPHIIWQISYDFPSLEFMRRAAGEKNVALSAVEFISGQFMQTGLAQSLLWLAGLFYLIFNRRGEILRFLGWCYLVVLAIMLLTHAKVYYLTPVYTVYIAAGAVWYASSSAAGGRRLLRPAMIILLVLLSLVALPFAIPVLKVEQLIVYSEKLGITPKPEEHSALAELPQYYADMFGWEEMVAQIGGIYAGLTEVEKRECVIYVRNYGEAAAIDFFGRKYGLPRALCAHNNYWYWKPGQVDFSVAIVFGDAYDLKENLADLQGPGRFDRVELVATTWNRYAMPFENNRQIFLCRGPQFTWEQIWPQERFFI